MVERIEFTSAGELRRVLAGRETPLVISGGVGARERAERWSPEGLLAALGGRTVSVLKSERERFDYDELGRRNYADFKTTFAEALRLVEQARPPGPYYYVRQASLTRLGLDARGLPAEGLIPPAAPRRSHLWLSSAGCLTPLHYDGKNNLLTQTHGTKRVTLLTADEYEGAYPYGVGHYAGHASRVDPERVDAAAFPAFPAARLTTFDLAPGDTLYIPAFWWHHVRSLELSVSVNDWWPARPAQYLVAASVDYLRLRYARERLRQIFADEAEGARPAAFARLAREAQARKLSVAATLLCGAGVTALLETLARAHGLPPPASGDASLHYNQALAERGVLTQEEAGRAHLSLVLAEVASSYGKTPKGDELAALLSEVSGLAARHAGAD